MRETNMRMRVVATGLVVGLAVLAAGCGSSDDKTTSKPADDPTTSKPSKSAEYCAAVKAAQADMANFASDSPDLSRFSAVVAGFKDIASKAPADVKPLWDAQATPLAALDDALKAANVQLTDVLGSASTGKLPKGVTQDQMNAIGQKLGTLQDPKIRESGKQVIPEVLKECSIDLSKVG
jgi:hypothetical protein